MFFNRKHSEKLTDEEIITLYQKKRNNKYIGILYERYYHIVFGVCLKYLKSIPESEDAVTLIFEKLIKDLKILEVNQFSGWLYVVSKNYCLQQLRKKKFVTVDFKELEEVLISEENLLLDKENKDLILDKLELKIELLKEEHKQCLTLFYLHQKSYLEIQSLTGLTLKSVKSHIQNGKRKLKILIEKEYKAIMEK